MIVAIVAETMTACIPARSRREAMDWSLVLVSQGIETTIDFNEESGWGLAIPDFEFERACGILQQYQVENRQWPWRQKIPGKSALFDWGSTGWVILISFFFWLQTHVDIDFRTRGLMDTVAVSGGEWWRLFTAIFLHADIGHLAMNASIGLLLLGLTMGSLGTGWGLLAAYLAGVGGNLAVWLLGSTDHRSLGASGMVMGCLGLLAMQSLSLRHISRDTLKNALSGIFGGVMLFALFGLDPSSDILAHIGGFGSGLILGILFPSATRMSKSKFGNFCAGLMFCLLVIFPWWLALSGGNRR